MKKISSTISDSDLRSLAATLTRAFMNDPLQCYVFPDEEERRRMSADHFASVIRYGSLFGEVYCTDRKEGAVVWLPPGATDVTPEKAEQGGLADLPSLIGEDAASRFFTVMEYLEPFHQQDAPEPHWYTMVIGVDPSFAGQGLGRTLMEAVLSDPERSVYPVYLETAQPDNIPFYQKLGFRVVRELIEPVSRLPLWTFRRDAPGSHV